MLDDEFKENSFVELEQDPVDGVYKPVGVKTERKQVRARRTKADARQDAIGQVAKQINIPEVEQFLYGANAALGLWERFRKAMK